MHDKAIEAACRATLPNYWGTLAMANQDAERKVIRRAIAAFLRAWEPSLAAAEQATKWGNPLGGVAEVTARELETDNA